MTKLQNNEKNEKENGKASEEILYTGSKIPKFFYGVYILFFAWAAYYFITNLLPDLMSWLKK